MSYNNVSYNNVSYNNVSYNKENEMSHMTKIALAALLVAVPLSAAQAKEKVRVSCFYESGQNQGQKISDYTIVNMHGPKVPKGTVIHFTLNAVPGKEYTATAPKDLDVMDDFSTGGTYPAGGCEAWWEK